MTAEHIDTKPVLRTTGWLVGFLALHLLGWTFFPALLRHNLPLDAIEGVFWGHQLEWGYDKNPFLNGWLTALAMRLGHQTDWMVYLFSQLSVVSCLLAIFLLAKRMMPAAYALLAVMMLEGIQYYNFHAIDFNDNTLELGLWAWTIYFFYRALQPSQKNVVWHWMLTGVFAGLGMMAKYYTALLLAVMFLFLIAHRERRALLKTLPPYLGLFIFLIIVLPHIIWLFQHDFPTIHYTMARLGHPKTQGGHLLFPLQFTLQQIEALLPMFLLSIVLLGRKKEVALQLTPFNRDFLWTMAIGPLLLTLLISLCFGITLRSGWGMPLFSLWGIVIVSYLKPIMTQTRLNRYAMSLCGFTCLLFILYSISLYYSDTPTTAYFPGKTISQTITTAWHEQYHQSLNYVAGSRWVGGNLARYSKDHPAVFPEWNPRHAAWIEMNELKKRGAVFIWNISEHEYLPDKIKRAFPNLSKPMILTFPYEGNSHPIKPVQVGVAFLAPTPAKNG